MSLTVSVVNGSNRSGFQSKKVKRSSGACGKTTVRQRSRAHSCREHSVDSKLDLVLIRQTFASLESMTHFNEQAPKIIHAEAALTSSGGKLSQASDGPRY